MGTGRKFAKKSMTRPKKGARERRRREKMQQRRLVAAGMSEEAVRHLTAKEMRELLKRPADLSPNA